MRAVFPLTPPEHYEAVTTLIDQQSWTVGQMLFHVMSCLNIAIHGMAPDEQEAILKMVTRAVRMRHQLPPYNAPMQ